MTNLKELFEKTTGKNAVWRGEETNAFKDFKKDFVKTIDDDVKINKMDFGKAPKSIQKEESDEEEVEDEETTKDGDEIDVDKEVQEIIEKRKKGLDQEESTDEKEEEDEAGEDKDEIDVDKEVQEIIKKREEEIDQEISEEEREEGKEEKKEEESEKESEKEKDESKEKKTESTEEEEEEEKTKIADLSVKMPKDVGFSSALIYRIMRRVIDDEHLDLLPSQIASDALPVMEEKVREFAKKVKKSISILMIQKIDRTILKRKHFYEGDVCLEDMAISIPYMHGFPIEPIKNLSKSELEDKFPKASDSYYDEINSGNLNAIPLNSPKTQSYGLNATAVRELTKKRDENDFGVSMFGSSSIKPLCGLFLKYIQGLIYSASLLCESFERKTITANMINSIDTILDIAYQEK